MVCIYCRNSTQVVNSRLQKKSNNIWRRRKCLVCAAVFTTQEHAALSSGFVVAKPGVVNPSPFHREILFLSIVEACGHRQRSAEDAIGLTETIISLLPFSGQGAITTDQIAKIAYEVLSRFDKVAATYYRAYHLDR